MGLAAGASDRNDPRIEEPASGTSCDMAGEAQRGFSLVEITVAVAIIAVVAASSVAFALASRPTALWAATTQFDSMLSAARSIGAAYGDGATIFVSASPGPSNFRADLYAHRPSATASATPMPSQVQPIIAQVAINESQLLGPPPFAVIIHGNGDIGVRKNYSRGDPVTDAELPCPPSNQFIFVFTVNGQTATRTLNCHTPLAYTGSAKQIPPSGGGATPTPWAMPSCDPTDNGCPIPPGSPATPAACPPGTTIYNGVCRAPLILTVTGPTAKAGQCAWTVSLVPCAFTVSEQYYPAPNILTAISTSASPCTANYTIASGSGSGSLVIPNAYSGTSPKIWSITPQALDGSSCTLVIYDDRGPGDPDGSALLLLSTSACPAGFTGTPPNCQPLETNPSPSPTSLPDGLYMIGGQVDSIPVYSDTPGACDNNGASSGAGGLCGYSLDWAWSFSLVVNGSTIWTDPNLNDYASKCVTTEGGTSCTASTMSPDPGVPNSMIQADGAMTSTGGLIITNINNAAVTNAYYNDMTQSAQQEFNSVYGASPPTPTPGPVQPTPCSQANSEAGLC